MKQKLNENFPLENEKNSEKKLGGAKRLNVKELLEVQGGLEDSPSEDCGLWECMSHAKSCYTQA